MNLSDIAFIDIETVSQYAALNENAEDIIKLWHLKHDLLYKNDIDISYEQSYNERAAIYAEFGKVICITIGIYDQANDVFRLKTLIDEDEKKVLSELIEIIHKMSMRTLFCGHNIKEFDIPYLCRRMLVNRLKIPYLINVQNKKPWEVNSIDTMQMWRFGDYKNYTSLQLLTTIFDIPSPKQDMDGSMVGYTYWHEKDMKKIKKYCEQDVEALIMLYIRLSEIDMDFPLNIEYVSE